MPQLKLSVFIIASHPLSIFQGCVKSVLEALPPSSEAVILINGDQPEKQHWLEEVKNPRLLLLHSKKTCVSRLRNRAFTDCSGDIIHFVDDDVLVPKDLFFNVLNTFEQEPEIAVLGGPNLTPPNSPYSEKLFGAVLTSPFAAPFVHMRYTKRKMKRAATALDLMFCNLAIQKAACPLSLRFYEGLYPNEETFFLHRARRLKLKTVFAPELFVFHHRRRTFLGFAKQITGYGSGRAKQTLIAPLSLPVPFILSICFMMILYHAIPSSLAFLSLYILASLVGWILSTECRETKFLGLVLCPLLTLSVHLCYFFGFVKSIVSTNPLMTQLVTELSQTESEGLIRGSSVEKRIKSAQPASS